MNGFSWTDLPVTERPGDVSTRTVTGAQLQAVRARFHGEPGRSYDPHTHPHEQLFLLVSGRAEILVGDERVQLGAGEGVVVPGGVRHGLTILEGPLETIEVFSPPRDDLR